jgi:hypothetical protein
VINEIQKLVVKSKAGIGSIDGQLRVLKKDESSSIQVNFHTAIAYDL